MTDAGAGEWGGAAAGTPERLTEVAHDGLVFDVTDAGPLDGPVVLLLHGFPTDRTSWDRIAPLLNAAGLRTIAPDLRGYSPRARPEARAAYAMSELVGDGLAFADAAGAERFHVVGHDWGGGLAWALAGSAPGRVLTCTALSTPHPGAMNAALLRGGQVFRSWYMLAVQVPWLPERAMLRLLRRGISGLPEADLKRYAARFRSPADLTGPLGWYRALHLSRGTVHRCRVPATLVWGRRDPYLGRAAAEATARLCLADYAFVELDEGHWLPEVASQACADAILTRVGGTGG